MCSVSTRELKQLHAYQQMFDLLPVASFELDLSDFRSMLTRPESSSGSLAVSDNRDDLDQVSGSIRVTGANKAARSLVGCDTMEDVPALASLLTDCVTDAAGVVLSGGSGRIPTRVAATSGEWVDVEAWLAVPREFETSWERAFLFMTASSESLDASGGRAIKAAGLRSIIDNAPVGYQSLDAEGRILEVNQTWLDILGYRRENVIGSRFVDFVSPKHRDRFIDGFAKFTKKGAVTGAEYEMMHADGFVRSLLFNGRVIFGADGSLVQTVCIMQDITERSRIEKELRESELRFQQLASTISEIFWLRSEHEILYVSPAYERIVGRSRESLYDDPSSFLESVHPTDREFLRMANEREWQRGVPMDLEVRMVRDDGTTRWIWIRSFHIHNERGEIVRSAGIAEDVTDRKHAEDALHESIARFRNIVEAAEAGYFFVDLEGRYGYVNNAWLHMHGYDTPGEVIGRPFDITLPDMDGEIAPINIESMLSSDKGFQCECARLRKDGSIGYHLFSGNPVVANGRQIGIEGFLIDITDRKNAEEALKESEERFRAAFQTSPDAIAINRESDGMYVDVNEGFERITGYTRGEIVGISSLDMDIWVDRADRMRLVDMLSERGYVDNLIAKFRMKDGRIITGNMCARTVTIGGLRHNLTITRDITQQRAAEEILTMRDRVLAAVAASADILLRRTNLDNALNQVLRKVGLAAKVSRAYVFRNDQEVSESLCCSKIAEWADDGIEPQMDNPDMQHLSYARTGMEYWIGVLGNNEAIFGETETFGEPIRSVFADQDILSIAIVPIFAANRWWGFMGFDDCREKRQWSRLELDALRSAAGIIGARIERQRAEQALRDSEEKFREIAELLPEAVYETDTEGVITFANRKAYEYFGYEAQDFQRGVRVFDMLAPEDRERAIGNLRQVINKGVHGAVEYTGVRKDGARFPISVRSNRVHRNGIPVGTRGVVMDISQQKAFEHEHLRTQKLESLGILAGGIAHDFNNLLTGILGNISIARLSDILDPEVNEGLEEAERAAMRARDLTRQLLTFSKGGEPVMKVVSPAQLIREAISFALRGSSVKPEIAIVDGVWCLNADAGQIGQVIHNLAINAVQAMPDGGRLRVTVDNLTFEDSVHHVLPAGKYVSIEVADEGLGIPDRLLQRIFDPYFTTKQTGSGLGLATSYSIVKKHQGHIDVESLQGAGTTFTVYLPATEGETDTSEGALVRDLAGSGKILLMDDEDYIRDLGARILSRYGYEVECVAHGGEAIERFAMAAESGKGFDLAILDLTIPGGMGGRETLEKIHMIRPDLPAIVCSGYSSDPIISRYNDFGFAAMVAKPYRPEDLVQAVATLLAATSAQKQPR